MPLQISYADAPEKRNHNESRLPQRTHGSVRKALPVFEALLLSRLCRQDCGDCTAKTALHSGMRSFLPDRRSQFHNVRLLKERAFYDLSIVIANHLKERVINRRLNQYTVALFCQSAYRHRKGEYHGRGFYKPFRLWLPVKPTVKPAIQRVKIFPPFTSL